MIFDAAPDLLAQLRPATPFLSPTIMSNFASIATYRFEVDKILRYGGSTRETAVRRVFFNLINAYACPHDLLLVEELDYFNPCRRKAVRPDGTLKNILRLD